MKTAVVTGATGFIGRELTERLISTDTRVYAIGRDEGKLESLKGLKNVIPIKADFEEYCELNKRIGETVDVFYHCAFQGGFSGEALKDHSLQLQNANAVCDAVIGAIRLDAKKFVMASTVNRVEALAFMSKNDVSPRYTLIYAAGKLAAEIMGKTLARNHGMAFCTALIAMPYGAGNRAKTLPNVVISQLLNGISPKLIEGNGKYDLIYIEDVAEGLAAIGERGGDFKDYYVGHRKLRTFRELMADIGTYIDPNVELLFGSYQDAPSVDYNLIDLDELYRDTGFECKTDFRESILKTAEWLRQQQGEGVS